MGVAAVFFIARRLVFLAGFRLLRAIGLWAWLAAGGKNAFNELHHLGALGGVHL